MQREAGTEAVQLSAEFGKKECWLDRNMKDKSEEAMKEGVCGSEYFLCLLSDGYFKSAYCIKEMQWAFATRKKIISTYKAGANVGAILREAPETFRAAISGIDSIKLDGSDPDYFEVGIRKIATAAEEARAREVEEQKAEAVADAELASQAGEGGDAGSGAGGVGGPPKPKQEPSTGGYEHGGATKGGRSVQGQAVVTIFYKGGGLAERAAELKRFCVGEGALPDNVTVSDISTDPVANDGMWMMIRAAPGLGNSVSLPVVTVGGPHLTEPRVFLAPNPGSDDVVAALAGDEGMKALDAKKAAREAARQADLAKRDAELAKGLVDIKLAWEGDETELLAHPGSVGGVMGIYKRLSDRKEGGRYVYEKVGDARSKLHFVASHDMWFVGPQPGQACGTANVSDKAEAPDMVVQPWEVIRKGGGGWEPAVPLVARRVEAEVEVTRQKQQKLAERQRRGVVVYGRPQCPLSNAFEQLLKSHGVKYKAVNVDTCDAYWDLEMAAVKSADPSPEGSLLPTIDAGGRGFYGCSPWEHAAMMVALKAAREAAEAAE